MRYDIMSYPLLDMCVGVPLRVWQTFASQGISSCTSDTVSGYGCVRSSSSDPLHMQLLSTDRPFRVCTQLKGCRFIAWLCPVSVVVSLSKKVNSHCSSISNCIIVDLVSTGEVAYPAVTSMGTRGSKYQPFMPHIQVKAKVGLHAHTFTCETWYSFLQSPGGYANTDS